MFRRWYGKRAIVALLVTVGCHRNARPAGCVPYPQLGPVGSVVSLPSVADAPAGKALLVGTVADSLTGRVMHEAVVWVRLIDYQQPDSAFAYTTDEGQFTLRPVRPGRYRYRVGAIGYQLGQGIVDLKPGIDTLQVRLKQGPPICDVRLD